jgi:dihydropteroate synthase
MDQRTNADFEAKNTLFLQHATLNCGGKLLSLARPVVMGILNVTPDSFHDGGKFLDLGAALARVSRMLDEGAAIIDIGAVSTRPGSQPVSATEELDRLLPVIESVLQKHPDTIVSVDTWRAEVAQKVVAAGASMINDISGGSLDDAMFRTIARLNVPYVLMHIQGNPQTMHLKPTYMDVTSEVIRWIADRTAILRSIGVKDIIADPGFGFGKSIGHNYTLLKHLEFFRILKLPLLVGISRKSLIYKPLDINPEGSLTGSIALNYHALTKGASILRVHDVKEAVQTVKIFEMVNQFQSSE